MMRHENDEQIEILDQQFENILFKLKPYLLSLPASKNSKLCRLWLERLNCTQDQRSLRNDYLLELYKQLKNGCYKSPFTEPPLSGRLIPISNCHRLVTSSSCNELTETSFSPCEEKKRVLPKPRSKSLRRDTGRCKIPVRDFNIHSSSSPNRVSRSENSAPSPAVHFYEQSPDYSSSKTVLRSYREKIEKLNSIVRDLEIRNEKLKHKLSYYHKSLAAGEIPSLHARIKQLMAEIENLKSKLKEVQEIKDVLEMHHKEIVEQYKQKLMEQFNKMKSQLEFAHSENNELARKVALFEQKLKEPNKLSERAQISSQEWEQKIENVKNDYKSLLQEKDEEIKKKAEIVEKKEKELSQRLVEISALTSKMKDLQRSMSSKSQDEEKVRMMVGFKNIRDEMFEMIRNMECTARKQSECHQKEIAVLKKNLRKLENLTQRLTPRLESDEAIADSKVLTQAKCSVPVEKALLDKHNGIDDSEQFFETKYKELLNFVESLADSKRSEYVDKLAFLESQMSRLQNG